jgi:hypothetical protein
LVETDPAQFAGGGVNEHEIRTFLIERYEELMRKRHSHDDALYFSFTELSDKLYASKHAGVGRGGMG